MTCLPTTLSLFVLSKGTQSTKRRSVSVKEVEDVVMNFKSYAEKVEIDEHWIRKIERVLEEIRK